MYPDADQTLHTVKARRLTIVSAGAMGSSLILERSGIGAKDILEKAGIKQLVDLPGVGKEYHGMFAMSCQLTIAAVTYGTIADHAFYVTPYVAADDATTYDPLFRGEPAEWGSEYCVYVKSIKI